MAVFLACRGAQRTVSEAWVASVAVWALSYGLRGILWHQLTDLETDRAAGVRTFARRYPLAFLSLGRLLALFANRPEDAMRAYRAFIRDGLVSPGHGPVPGTDTEV